MNPENTLPKSSIAYAFLSNSINNHTIYYLSGINCFKDENTSSASNHIELRTLVLNDRVLQKLRKIRNWRSGIVQNLGTFTPQERSYIFDSIYGENRENLRLATDWIKLVLLGTKNYYVFLTSQDTGVTCEGLMINRTYIENYLVFKYF